MLLGCERPDSCREPIQTGRKKALYFPLDNSRYNDYFRVVTSHSKNSRSPVPLEDRLFVALLTVADALSLEAEQLVKSASLSGAQYNVLRILRGAEPQGLACSTIGDRMISHDPDITRLLDRMAKRGLITRERQTHDRRVVLARITSQGLEMLKTLDQPIHDLHKRQFRHIPMAHLKALAELLEELRRRGVAE